MTGMDRVSTVPERLKEVLEELGMRPIDLARKTGLSHSTISRYLAGKVEPGYEAIIKLADGLGVQEWWLYGYDVPKARTPEQKKNDDLRQVVAKLRNDPEFFEVVTMLAKLPEEEYKSVKQLLSSLVNK